MLQSTGTVMCIWICHEHLQRRYTTQKGKQTNKQTKEAINYYCLIKATWQDWQPTS